MLQCFMYDGIYFFLSFHLWGASSDFTNGDALVECEHLFCRNQDRERQTDSERDSRPICVCVFESEFISIGGPVLMAHDYYIK